MKFSNELYIIFKGVEPIYDFLLQMWDPKISKLYVQYGKDYEFDAPVKLLDKHLHAMAESVDEQLVVISQVSLVASLIIFPMTLHFIILVPDFTHLELITFVLKICALGSCG